MIGVSLFKYIVYDLNKLIKIASIIILICFSDNLLSQPTTWQRIFGGIRDDYARITLETKDGNYLMIGERQITLITGFPVSQISLTKFNSYGNILWTKNIGDSLRGSSPTSAVEMRSGNILITYMHNDWGNLMKIDAEGNVIWDSSYIHPVSGFYFISLINNQKNVIINGDRVGGMDYIAAIFKLDTNGNLYWSKGYNDGLSYIGYLNNDNAFYSVGLKNNSTAFAIKKDTSGKVIWYREISNNNHFFRFEGISQISNSTFITIGNISIPGKYVYSGLYATKYDSSGNFYWNKNYLSDSMYARRIIKARNNVYVITGGQGEPVGKLCSIDSSGNLLLKKFYYYNSTAIVDYDNIQNCSDSGFIISGYYNHSPSSYSDFLVLKTDKNFNFSISSIENNNIHFPELDFIVSTYPNPFNPEINIKIELKKKRNLSITIYDSEGKEMKSISKLYSESGTTLLKIKTIDLNLSSGIYFLRVSDSEYSIINKIIYLK